MPMHSSMDRRRFMEAMLSGVSAGVLGWILRVGYRWSTPRHSLLGIKQENLLGEPLDAALPDFGTLYNQAMARASGMAEGQVTVRRPC